MALQDRDIVIAGFARSPHQVAEKGALAEVRPDDLLAQLLSGLLTRTGVPADAIEDLLVGCAFPEGEQGFNLARMVVLLAGLPDGIGGATVNRWCGSSMTALHMAAGSIAAGAGDVFLVAGVESMSRVPMMGFNPAPNPDLADRRPGAYASMGETAEALARAYAIPRAEQDAFALRSHHRAAAAAESGGFADELVAIATEDGETVATDGTVRPDSSLDALAKLRPAFDAEGTVTAGTSSPLTDGASALLVVSGGFAKAHGLRPLAKLRAMAVSGCDPAIMGIGPVQASRKALYRAGLTLAEMDAVEINEAFAAQVLAVDRELGFDWERTNIDGGAIALGHPLGASGARIAGKAAQLLKRRGGAFALATLCIGGGQGLATVLEAV